MEIIFVIVGIIVTIVGIEERSPKITISGIMVIVVPWAVGWLFTTTTVITHMDVLEYDKTVYSTPKTFEEIRDNAPFWSCQDSSTMKLKVD